MAISTNQKPTIYRNLYENTGPVHPKNRCLLWYKIIGAYFLRCFLDSVTVKLIDHFGGKYVKVQWDFVVKINVVYLHNYFLKYIQCFG